MIKYRYTGTENTGLLTLRSETFHTGERRRSPLNAEMKREFCIERTLDPPAATNSERTGWHGVFGVAFSPDTALLATSSADGFARLWNTTTGAVIQALRGQDEIVYKF